MMDHARKTAYEDQKKGSENPGEQKPRPPFFHCASPHKNQNENGHIRKNNANII